MHMVDAAVTLSRLERFAGALSLRLGLSVEPVQVRTYAELSTKLDEAELELAWLPPVVALSALELGLAAPLVAPTRAASATFSSALFARRGAAVRDLRTLSGARAAWVDRESAGGYAVIRAALRARGVEPGKLFARESFEGSHQAVLRAVLDGTADVGATYVHRDPTGELKTAGWGDAGVQVVFEHGPIPADVLAASAELAPELAETVAAALLDASASELATAARELFEAEGFVRVRASHLDPLRILAGLFDSVRQTA
jgi:ABC-type phosphate/phosphonate transport system substrate-binding protein